MDHQIVGDILIEYTLKSEKLTTNIIMHYSLSIH